MRDIVSGLLDSELKVRAAALGKLGTLSRDSLSQLFASYKFLTAGIDYTSITELGFEGEFHHEFSTPELLCVAACCRSNLQALTALLAYLREELSEADFSELVVACSFCLYHDSAPLTRFLIKKKLSILESFGFDYRTYDRNGAGALNLYASTADSFVVAILLSKPVDIHHKTTAGDDALWVAVLNNQLKTVRLLLRHGASPNNSYVVGNEYIPTGSALDLAKQRKHSQILELLAKAE